MTATHQTGLRRVLETAGLSVGDSTAALLEKLDAPKLDLACVKSRVRETYGLDGVWSELGGEREQNFRLALQTGEQYVVKIGSAAEDPRLLHFQCEALSHIEEVDSSIGVPKVRETLEGAKLSSIVSTSGQSHPLRLLSYLEGDTIFDRIRSRGFALSIQELSTLGQAHGRLSRALQGFFHSSSSHLLAWDLANGLSLKPWMNDFLPAALHNVAAEILHRFASQTLPNMKSLRSQVIYNDFHESNVLVGKSDPLDVVGVIDFGDMIYGAVAQDLAVSVASFIHGNSSLATAASAIVRGYQQFMPLQQEDLDVLLDLVLVRMLLQVALTAYERTINGRRNSDLDELQDIYAATILELATVKPREFVALMAPSVSRQPSVQSKHKIGSSALLAELMSRRKAVLGAAYTFYDEPLHLVGGLGCRLFDAGGRQYLDCYNNVPNVGHCHPHVVQALAIQAATLNTSTRYLHDEILRLGHRLSSTLPAGLDTWVFVCTGSEANDLAVRMARTITGKEGVIVNQNSYHGNTTVMTALSLLEYDERQKPDWVGAVPPPNVYRGVYRAGEPDLGRKYAAHVGNVAMDFESSGIGSAALLLDSIFDANGALVPPDNYMAEAFGHARTAGALCIADEVQMGFGRSGSHMWGFQAFGVTPDIVTMGKPMGNGHPIAALVTRREIADEFQKHIGYFNTFGGNPVSCAVGNATLDVLLNERLQQRALSVGTHLKRRLDRLAERHAPVGYVHGRGLFYGVELVSSRATADPARKAARWVREHMKANGVLVASSGPLGNIIKIRPPLAFTADDADECVDALDLALSQLPDSVWR
jgi:4-aminobutyrate aminotransferase-like enzyme/Ser/Thr protein kinase RdoA (MazF antagonist)